MAYDVINSDRGKHSVEGIAAFSRVACEPWVRTPPAIVGFCDDA
jgi:hypothetical protein